MNNQNSASSGVIEPEKASFVENKLFIINEKLTDTYNKCKCLEHKLSMVLTPSPDYTTEEAKDKIMQNASIIIELDCISTKIDAVNIFLSEVIERVVC